MDYRLLLIKYIARVRLHEGVDFVEPQIGDATPGLVITPEEQDELRRCRNEARALWGNGW